MVAHLDAVTCLAVDPNGVFLMSGSKLGLFCCSFLRRVGGKEKGLQPWQATPFLPHLHRLPLVFLPGGLSCVTGVW